jgi:hypothetical protein
MNNIELRYAIDALKTSEELFRFLVKHVREYSNMDGDVFQGCEGLILQCFRHMYELGYLDGKGYERARIRAVLGV